MLTYPKRQSEGVLLREGFVNEEWFSKNSWTKYNAPTVNNGMALDGINQYISTPLPVVPRGDFTVRISFTPDTITGIQGLWGQYTLGGSGRLAMYSISDTLWMRVGGTTANLGGGYLAGIKQQLTITRSGAAVSVYKDGSTTPIMTLSDAVSIEQSVNFLVGVVGSSYFDGVVHSVEVLNRATTADEHLDWYQRDTFTEIDASKMEIALPLRSHYFDAGVSKEVTSNLGQINSDQIQWGDGSTSTTYPTLLENNGVSMDGGDSARVPRTLSIAAGESYSFGALVQPIGSVANDYLFTLKDTDSNGLACYLNATTDTLIFFGDNGGSSRLVSVAGMGPSKGLYHVACIYSFNGATYDYYVYVNGELSGSSLGRTGFTPSTGDVGFTLGCNELYTNGWAGTIRFPMLERVAWTPTQIKELSNQMFSNLNV